MMYHQKHNCERMSSSLMISLIEEVRSHLKLSFFEAPYIIAPLMYNVVQLLEVICYVICYSSERLSKFSY